MSIDSNVILLKRANLLLGDSHQAALRFAEALKQPENDLVRDAAIQRFEFCFELAWKSIQAVARLEGQECTSPRNALSTAWRAGWIGDEALWLDMLNDRNKTSHTYREAMAREVFENLVRYVSAIVQLQQSLATRVREIEIQVLRPPAQREGIE